MSLDEDFRYGKLLNISEYMVPIIRPGRLRLLGLETSDKPGSLVIDFFSFP